MNFEDGAVCTVTNDSRYIAENAKKSQQISLTFSSLKMASRRTSCAVEYHYEKYPQPFHCTLFKHFFISFSKASKATVSSTMSSSLV